VLIEGRDSIWVNGVMSKFNDLILAFAPQNTFVKRHWAMLCIIGALGIGCIMVPIIDAITRLTYQPDPNYKPSPMGMWLAAHSIAVPIVKHAMGSVIGFFVSAPLVVALRKLWPLIELATGPEHAQIERKRRIWLLNFTLLTIIPLIVNIVYDVLKALF
jgi:hypothetical protein